MLKSICSIVLAANTWLTRLRYMKKAQTAELAYSDMQNLALSPHRFNFYQVTLYKSNRDTRMHQRQHFHIQRGRESHEFLTKVKVSSAHTAPPRYWLQTTCFWCRWHMRLWNPDLCPASFTKRVSISIAVTFFMVTPTKWTRFSYFYFSVYFTLEKKRMLIKKLHMLLTINFLISSHQYQY